MNKHFFNALMFDIFNWGTKIAIACFLFKMDVFYGTLITGLQISKIIADVIYKKALHDDLAQRQQNMLNDLESQLKQKYPDKTLNEAIVAEIEEEMKNND